MLKLTFAYEAVDGQDMPMEQFAIAKVGRPPDNAVWLGLPQGPTTRELSWDFDDTDAAARTATARLALAQLGGRVSLTRSSPSGSTKPKAAS